MEHLKDFASICGYVMAIITLLTLIIKPLREKFVEWLNKKVGTTSQNVALAEIKEQLNQLLENKITTGELLQVHSQIHLITIENRITNLYYKYLDQDIPMYERKLLIRQYELYHHIGGNGNMTKMYEELMAKKICKVEHTEL